MAGRDPFGWIGATIADKYRIEDVAGAGGFGVVYRGTHLGFDMPIAVKCLQAAAGKDEAERAAVLAAFNTEARLLRQLSARTAHIVSALDVGAEESPSGLWTPYIAMDWLDGETLEQNIQRHPAGRSIEETVELLAPLARALAIAHAAGVSHRDVKPANVFLVSTPSGPLLKVLDFGIAKVFAETPSLTQALQETNRAVNFFTPRYAAPEQFSPQFGATGPWTDVYALALVFIEAATGRPALTGANTIQFYVASCDEANRPSLRARRADVDVAIESALQQALAVRPALRFLSAGEMWSALDPGAGTPSAAAPRASAPPPASAPVSSVDANERAAPSQLPTAREVPAGAGENRVCTAMLIDLSGVAALVARVDPAEAEEVVERCLTVASEQIEAMGGLVDERAGDTALAVFGALGASDSDAERAVLAALRVQAAIAKIPLPRETRPARAAARIGISTGRAFAGRMAGTARRGFAIVGEPVTVAARLQQAAPPASVVIGRDTYRQVATRFNVEPLPQIAIPGRSERMPAYRVTGPIAFQHAFAVPEFYGLATKLAGRKLDVQNLSAALDAVIEERRASLLTLAGPAGVGRTRMLAEMIGGVALRSEKTFVMTAQCSALATDSSYLLTASLIRRRFAIEEGAPPDVVHKRLRRGVRWFRARAARGLDSVDFSRDPSDISEPSDASLDGPPASRDPFRAVAKSDLNDALKQIAAILGGQPISERGVAPDEDAGAIKNRIAAAVASLIRFVASELPVLIVCDDVQWADDASLDLLDQLVMRVEDLPVFVVCSARADLYDRRPHWGEGKTWHRRLDLGALSRRNIEDMIRDRLRLVPQLSDDFVRILANRAENNPLILEETMHLLVDAGIIEVKTSGPWVVHEDKLGDLELPATIQGIVQARLDRLDAETRSGLGHAAVVGRTFWEGAVTYLKPSPKGSALAVDHATLLQRLRERKLVLAHERTTIPGEREYVFAESATYEVAYEMLPLRQRRTLHELVADWLKSRVRGDADPAMLALHYDRGGKDGPAALAYTRAAKRASSLGQNQDALRLLIRARALDDQTATNDAPRDAGFGDDTRVIAWPDRVRLRLDLGDVLRRLSRWDEALSAYEAARAAIVRNDRRTGATLRPLEPMQWDARIDYAVALTHMLRGENAEARALAERAIALATGSGIIAETPGMYAQLALIRRRQGSPDDSFRAARTALRICRSLRPKRAPSGPDGRPPLGDAEARLLLGIAAAQFAKKRMVAAERTYRQVLRVLGDRGNPDILGRAMNGIAATHLKRNNLHEARDMFMRSLRVKERTGDLHQLAIGYSNVAEIDCLLGNYAAALPNARHAVSLAEKIQAGSDLAEIYRHLADACAGTGDFEAALDAIAKALAVAETSGQVYLADVALAHANLCVRAFKESPALRARAVAAAKGLVAALRRSFTKGELSKRADECREMLAPILRE